MNFLKRKQQKIIVSDQTTGSKISLSSNSANGRPGNGQNVNFDNQSYVASETIEFNDKSNENGDRKKEKHAHFALRNENLNNSNLEAETSNGSHDVGQINGDTLMGNPATGTSLLKGVHINEDGNGVTEENNKHVMPMYACVIRGDKNELKKLISAHSDLLFVSDNFGRSPLMYCVLADRLDCAKILLKAGCLIDQVDNAGRSALHLAAHKGSYKFLELLHSKGATLDMKDKDEQTPIHLSTRNRNAKCLEFLLRNIRSGMADVSDKQKRTALHWSAAFNNAECCRLLIKYGCNIAIPDDAGKTPLHWAANNQDPSAVHIMKMLLNNAPSLMNWQDYEGRTALHFAVADGNDAAVEFLLKFEAQECDVNRSDNTFRSQLHWATQLGHVHVVKLLLQSGAKNSMVDGNGAQPLLYAALNNHAAVVAVMIDNDPNVAEQTDPQGRNSLMWAAGKGSNDVIRVLLGLPPVTKTLTDEPLRSNGVTKLDITNEHETDTPNNRSHPKIKFTPVDINRADNKQNTALHVAAINGQAASVELLLSQNAHHDLRNDQNHTPIFGACEKGHLNAVKYLLDYDACITEVDLKKRSPLHWAALGGHAEVCEILIKEGLDVDIRDAMERTPLHCAAFGGFINCMNLLLENGANVDAQDNEGMSALHWAADLGHSDAVKLLFQYNVFLNPMEYNEERLTPLDRALQNDHDEIIQYLIETNALSAEAIRAYAAKRIQACFRGYQVRKTFLRQKQLLMKHKTEMLRRDRTRNRRKDVEGGDLLGKPLLDASLLSVATSTDGHESVSTSKDNEQTAETTITDSCQSNLLQKNLTQHDHKMSVLVRLDSELTFVNHTGSNEDLHLSLLKFESLKSSNALDVFVSEEEDNPHPPQDEGKLHFDSSLTSNKSSSNESRTTQREIELPKTKKTKPKEESYFIPTNCFRDVGNENNMNSHKVKRGLAYKSILVQPQTSSEARRLLHVPVCLLEDEIDVSLCLTAYIESLMHVCTVERASLLKFQKQRKNAFTIAHSAATVIQKHWRRYLARTQKLKVKSEMKLPSSKPVEKVKVKKTRKSKQATKRDDVSSSDVGVITKAVTNSTKHDDDFSVQSQINKIFEPVAFENSSNAGRSKRQTVNARVPPTALSAANSPRSCKPTASNKDKKLRSADSTMMSQRKSASTLRMRSAKNNKSIAELPTKWQSMYNDVKLEGSRVDQPRKNSTRFSYNLREMT